MNEETTTRTLLDIPGYYYDKKKNRYFLINNELKKELKKEEFNKSVNNAKKKNRDTNNAETKKWGKKKFHQIHGIKEMKKKKKNANNNKLNNNIKNYNEEDGINTIYTKKKSYNIINSKETKLELINNELNFLKKNICENQNIFNLIKRIKNYNFKEDSILSLPPIFINSNSCEYIQVEDLCEYSSNKNSFCHKENDCLDILKSPRSFNNKRTDNIDVSLNDYNYFNSSQKLIDKYKRKNKNEFDNFNKNESFDTYRKYRKNSIFSNQTDEYNVSNYNYTNKKYYCDNKYNLTYCKNGNNMFSCINPDYIEENLLIPKLYGRTYEKLNSCNIKNIKSKIRVNRYKANFYYFYNNTYDAFALEANNTSREMNMNNNNDNDANNDSNDNNNNNNNNNSNIYNNNIYNNNIYNNNIYNNNSGRHFISFNNISSDTIYQEMEVQSLEDSHMPIGHLDAVTNETRISKTHKPSESFFHLFSNPQYDDIVFSTTKENNFSFSLGAIDMNNFVQKNKKSSIYDVIHENVYYSTDTKYLCSYSKEKSELLCISPQILSHFNIFNGEYVAYSSYPNTKDEKSLLCLLSIKSFFQCNPKIEIYSFPGEVNYFKLFPSIQSDNYNNNNYSLHPTSDDYSFYHNNEIDKIFICGSYPCFSFSTLKNNVTYCIWDSKKLKVQDLLSMNEDLTSYIENIINGKQFNVYQQFENNSQKKLRLFSSKKRKKKISKEQNKNQHETFTDELYENNTKMNNDNKIKFCKKESYNESDLYKGNSEHFKNVHGTFNNKKTHDYSYRHFDNNNNNNNNYNPKKSPNSANSIEKIKNKCYFSYNHSSQSSLKYNYNDNKKKGICCENIKKSDNNIFLCCNTEYLYLCDLRCNLLNTISKLKPNEGYVNKIYSLNNNVQYVSSKTNNHIGLYDMRYINYKHNDETKSNLIVSYERFIDNDNLKKHLNDFYVIDNEQYIVSLDTYTSSVYIYDIMGTTTKIINLDGNSEYSKNNVLHCYTNLSKIPYIYSCRKYDDYYYNYYKQKIYETKATDSKYVNHFNPMKSYPKKDLFIGLNVQSILPLFYIKQKYNKHNFISINEGGFICTINI
ncbi:hypothetical protein PFMALIP_02002 [Plasmodium falciparum MaliPS096_E11]|uniref:Uncharacterized protein n=1 Tax=Plasmodium falciparum MaliPS096_E11 TaxID=1036727 RepID=A0A024WRW7_PLAFA|nr:hypothetical protein PFMALIP_02002 [Plasmodium falciparum MaliPS096_E11]